MFRAGEKLTHLDGVPVDALQYDRAALENVRQANARLTAVTWRDVTVDPARATRFGCTYLPFRLTARDPHTKEPRANVQVQLAVEGSAGTERVALTREKAPRGEIEPRSSKLTLTTDGAGRTPLVYLRVDDPYLDGLTNVAVSVSRNGATTTITWDLLENLKELEARFLAAFPAGQGSSVHERILAEGGELQRVPFMSDVLLRGLGDDGSEYTVDRVLSFLNSVLFDPASAHLLNGLHYRDLFGSSTAHRLRRAKGMGGGGEAPVAGGEHDRGRTRERQGAARALWDRPPNPQWRGADPTVRHLRAQPGGDHGSPRRPGALMMDMEAFLDEVMPLDPGFRGRIRGASAASIDELERHAGFPLPACYRAFLAAMGDADGGLHLVTDMCPTEVAKLLELYADREVRGELFVPPDCVHFAVGDTMFATDIYLRRHPDRAPSIVVGVDEVIKFTLAASLETLLRRNAFLKYVLPSKPHRAFYNRGHDGSSCATAARKAVAELGLALLPFSDDYTLCVQEEGLLVAIQASYPSSTSMETTRVAWSESLPASVRRWP